MKKNEQIAILLIDDQKNRRSIINRALNDFGYLVTEKLDNCNDIINKVNQHKAEILVIGTDIPNSATLSQLALLKKEAPRPIIMFAEKHTPQAIETSIKAGVSAYIVDDIQPQRMKSIIDVAHARFKEYQSLQKELKQTKTQLENRKLLEKAKGLLMKQKNLDEDEAYNTLRKMAMDKGQTTATISRNLIDAWELLG